MLLIAVLGDGCAIDGAPFSRLPGRAFRPLCYFEASPTPCSLPAGGFSEVAVKIGCGRTAVHKHCEGVAVNADARRLCYRHIRDSMQRLSESLEQYRGPGCVAYRLVMVSVTPSALKANPRQKRSTQTMAF